MQNISIHNSTVSINICEDSIGIAKDKLLTKLYYARNKDTIGGRAGWEQLLHMYYMKNYEGMKEFIKNCRGKGGKTRNECIHYINVIMGERN